MKHDVKDLRLAGPGQKRIEWAANQMPVLETIRRRFAKQRPFRKEKIAACLHVTSETANLAIALKDAGADVALCASNPLSTQDDVAAALVKHHGIPVFAIKGEDRKTYYKHLLGALAIRPTITMDDGADLVTLILKKQRELIPGIKGGTEETTTGVIRLRSMEKAGVLGYPIVAVNDANTKHLFDNRYGTGQSTLDGILRATNFLIAGSRFVVAGYGWVGRGVALRARGAGARVIVTEVDPTRALEAVMDGFEVMPMAQAAKIGQIFVTVTGNKDIVRKEHFLAMSDGAVVCNSGHFNVELDIEALEATSKSKRAAKPFVDEYLLKDGRRIYLLGEGRLINLTSAEGHPASVMDMSFANQALSVEYLVKSSRRLEKKVYRVPEEIDAEIARLKLRSMGIGIDRLTPEQSRYLASWQEGT
jgi:adenosylhomocysteinase